MNLLAAQGVAVREVTLKPGHRRADYLLYVDQRVVGVIGVRPEGTPLVGVTRQSSKYAEGLPAEVKLEALTKYGRHHSLSGTRPIVDRRDDRSDPATIQTVAGPLVVGGKQRRIVGRLEDHISRVTAADAYLDSAHVNFNYCAVAFNRQVNAVVLPSRAQVASLAGLRASPAFPRQMRESSSATTMPRLNNSAFGRLKVRAAREVDLPRFQSTLKECSSTTARAQAGTHRAAMRSAALRRAVVGAVFSGRLTGDWDHAGV